MTRQEAWDLFAAHALAAIIAKYGPAELHKLDEKTLSNFAVNASLAAYKMLDKRP